jgi:AraC-like DNA-binding protein
MGAKLTGAITTYETHALYVGPLIASARHRHHAGQVLWAPDGIDVAIGDEPVRRAIAHVLPPDRWHSHGGARMAAVLWVDRDDACWDRHAGSERGLPRLDGAPRALAEAMLSWVAAPDARTRVARHPAVERMRRSLDAHAGTGAIGVTRLAERSGLSVRQLRHRFTEQVGIPPSGYLRWRRLRRAIAAIERGATLTQGALEGGFADGAHFSRVFQAQFGVAPSRALSSLIARR